MSRRSKSSGRWLEGAFLGPLRATRTGVGPALAGGVQARGNRPRGEAAFSGRRDRRSRRRAGRLEPVRRARALGGRASDLRARPAADGCDSRRRRSFRAISASRRCSTHCLPNSDGRRVDLVLSDMAPNISGVDAVDQAARRGPRGARRWTSRGRCSDRAGVLVMKVFQGAGFQEILARGPARFQHRPHAQAEGLATAQFRDVFGGQVPPAGVR